MGSLSGAELTPYPGLAPGHFRLDRIVMARNSSTPNLARAGALLADSSRAAILSTLMDGREFTAGELARTAGISPQTCSSHLNQLLDAGFVKARPQGRHRYFSLASGEIAEFLETVQFVSAGMAAPPVTGPADQRLRDLRICYDHVAGSVAVALLESMIRKSWFESTRSGLVLSDVGATQLRALGVDTTPAAGQRPHCRECLDWSERRVHLAGTIGQRLLQAFLRNGWVKRTEGSRLLTPTPPGVVEIRRLIAG